MCFLLLQTLINLIMRSGTPSPPPPELPHEPTLPVPANNQAPGPSNAVPTVAAQAARGVEEPKVIADVRKGQQLLVCGKPTTMPGKGMTSVFGPPSDWKHPEVGYYQLMRQAMAYAHRALKARLLGQTVPRPDVPQSIYNEYKNETSGMKVVMDAGSTDYRTSFLGRMVVLYNILTMSDQNGVVNKLAHVLLAADYEEWKKCIASKKKLPQAIVDKLSKLSYPGIFNSFEAVKEYMSAYFNSRKQSGKGHLSDSSLDKMLSNLVRIFWCCGMEFEEQAERKTVDGRRLSRESHMVSFDDTESPAYPMNYFACTSIRKYCKIIMKNIFPDTSTKEKGKFHCQAIPAHAALECIAVNVPHCAMSLMSIFTCARDGCRPSESVHHSAKSNTFLLRLERINKIIEVPLTFLATATGKVFMSAFESGNAPYLARQPHNKIRGRSKSSNTTNANDESADDPCRYTTRLAYAWPIPLLNIAHIQVLVFKIMMLYYG